MATSLRKNALCSRLKALLTLQKFDRNFAETGAQAQFYAHMRSASVLEQGKFDMSNWRKLDSRTLGITRSMISVPSWIVLKVLQSAGFDAYLVGGCVRDLLLNKVPKDFDVITTATLRRIRKQFHHCEIVGRRFPICLVHVKGSVVEVSSFETVAENAKEKGKNIFSDMPHGCDKKDFVRWRDCMRRDFTINSLFFDPFVNKIYDYVDAMMDLKSLKLRTLIPAKLSFEEDCARILRGLRIAARLGLSFSKETEIAIRKLSSSTTRLTKSRIMMELNYMLSYGAAEPSLCLLRRFNLLDMLLPFHAAYLARQACKQSGQSPVMLMKLFFNLDKLVTCDRPSDCSLWVGLLVFHLALVNHPQDALVVWTFASVLYHGTWKEGVKFAREHAQAPTSFVPEFSEPRNFMSDYELAERVTQLASLVQDSVGAFTDTDILLQNMSRFPDFPCSGLVFVPKKAAKDTAELFSMLVHDVGHCDTERGSFDIDYDLLGKGDVQETRFVLGKIILDTMSGGVVQESNIVEDKDHLHLGDPGNKDGVLGGNADLAPPDIETRHIAEKENRKRNLSAPNSDQQQEWAKKQKLIGTKCNLAENGRAEKQKAVANELSKKKAKQKPEMVTKHDKMVKMADGSILQNEITQKGRDMSHLSFEETVTTRANALEKGECRLNPQEVMEDKQQRVENIKCQERIEKHLKVVKGKPTESSSEEVSTTQLKPVDKSQSPTNGTKHKEVVSENKKRHLHPGRGITEKEEEHKQDLSKENPKRSVLSSLFR